MGGGKTRDLLVRINGDTKGLEKALGKGQKGTKGFGAAMQKAKTGSFALLGGLTAAGVGAVAFGVKAFGAYNKAEEASTKLRTNMLNVKGATEENVVSMQRLADKMQGYGVIGDETIEAGMSQLATFNLQSSTIEKLTPKISDMVVQLKGHNATTEDMANINNLVGKVMTGNVGSLSRYGVTLDETQKKILQNGTEQEKANTLTKVLSQNYGEVNKALRNTPQGQFTAFKNTFGDFMEVAGEFVSNLVGPLISGFNGWMESMGGPEGMMDALKKKFEQIQPFLPIIAGAIMVGLVPAFVALAASVWATFAPLLPFLAAGAALGFLAKKLMDRFGGVKGIMDRLKPVLETIGAIFKDMIWPAIQQVWSAVQKELLPALKRLWDQIKPILIPVLKTLGIILGVLIVANIMIFLKALRIGIKVLSLIIGWFGNLIQWIKNAAGWFGRLPGMIGRAVGGLYNIVTAPFRKAFDWIKGLPGRIVGAVGNIGKLLRDKLGDWDIPGPLGKVRDVIPGFAKGVRNFQGGLAVVGEEGPELVNLPRGSDVIPNGQVPTGFRTNGSVAVASQPTQQTIINFDPTIQVGMFAGMPTEYREIAERMWVEFQNIAKSNGVNLQQIGVRSQ